MSVHLSGIGRQTRGGEMILDHVSLEIGTGEFIALVGPSGAGKTSLLRVIAGLDAQNTGSVVIDGQDVSAWPARRRGLGFVFQNYALFGHMSVAANIAFGLKVLPRGERPSRAQMHDRVEELLGLMQLPGRGAAYPAALSGGQRQRVALARALATRPRVLLLDEPFGALDPMVRREIRTWLRSLHDRLGLTTILVTHDREEAVEIADRLAIMQAGRLVQAGPPQQLERAPVSPFVTAFLGEVEHFEGTIRSGVFVPAAGFVRAFALPGEASNIDGPAELLIRPHEIGLEAGGASLEHVATHHGFARYQANGAVLVHRPEGERVPDGGVCLDVSRGRVFSMA